MSTATDTPPDHHPRPTPRRRRALAAVAAIAAVMLGASHLAPAGATTPATETDGPVAQQVEERLVLGDRGPSVASWQLQMNLIAAQGLVVDGIFGPATEQATVNFQRFFGQPDHGVVDTLTRDVGRLVLAGSQPDYVDLGTVGGVEFAGFTNQGRYCIDVRDYPAFSLRCSDVRSGLAISSAVIELGHPTTGAQPAVMVGTAAPAIAQVVVDPVDAESVDASLSRDVAGLDRSVWVSPVRAADVAVVRGLAGDGSEVRRIVVQDADTYLVLEFGDRGPAVATWQAQLNRATNAGLAENGVFGSSTLVATQNFQRFFGLGVDGIVGPNTRDTMEFVLAIRDAEESVEGPEALGEPTEGDLTSAGYPGDFPTALLTDVRVSGHDGFDRLVFQFEENLPEFQAAFVSPPILERPSDQPVPVPGNAFLEVTMARASAFDLTDDEAEATYPGPDRVAAANFTTVTEAVKTQDNEGFMTWTIGLDESSEYSVVQLDDPSRIVVDVRIPK